MQCIKCGHTNRPGSHFCSQCGAALAAVCPQCGADAQAGDKFCSTCGAALGQRRDDAPTAPPSRPTVPTALAEKIRSARSELDTEPRTVTILFVDTVNSVAGTQGLPLEVLHKLVQERTQHMADAVYQYEGTVLQFLGDGIMAVFGAPIAHEDSARRAILAALSMRERLAAQAEREQTAGGPAFQYRIGLNTGPVIVGNVGDDLSMDYLAVGDTVNLAARMEQAAEPGAIYVTESTRRQAEGYFAFRDLGGLTVKGKADSIPAFEVIRDLGARTRFEVSQQRGLTPLVGRDTELRTLRSYLDQVRQGAGQVVSIVGEPGIGKSRLLLEFRKSLDTEPHMWIQGQCVPHGRSIPYLPIADLLRSGFGIDEGDAPETVIGKIDRASEDWEPAARETVPYLRYLLDVDPGDQRVAEMNAQERRAGVFEALRAGISQTTGGPPVILVLEDLHWMDEPSEEAVNALIDSVSGLPVLFLLTYRPGYTASGVDRGYVSRIGLRNLSHKYCAEIARAVLGSEDLPEAMCSEVMAKAGGNPFYVEEVLRHLVESGVLQRSNGSYRLTRPLASEDIPGTIQDVIRSRMDRLDQSARETLQFASVIGREFTGRILSRITEMGDTVSQELTVLQEIELILRTSHFPELSYMFKHALTCDVAYESLLAERRRTLHRVIASAIEDLYADRLAEHYGTLAHHWYEGQDWPKALEYLEKVARQAADRDAMRDAIAHCTRALEVCARLGNVPNAKQRGWHQWLAHLHWAVSDLPTAAQHFEHVRDLARAAGERRAEGLAICDAAFTHTWCHEFDIAGRMADEAMAVARELGDEVVRARAMATHGELDILRGNLVEAAPMLEAALPLCRVAEGGEWWGRTLANLGLSQNWQGQYEQAFHYYDDGFDFADERIPLMDRMYVRWSRSLALCGAGRYAEAFSEWHLCITSCKRIGEIAFQSRAANSLGWFHNEFYDWTRSAQHNKAGLQLAEELGDPEIMANARLNMGDAALGQGDVAQAAEIVQDIYDSLPDLHEWMKWRYSQHCYHSFGEIRLAQGDLDAAVALMQQCLDLAESSNSRKYIVKARRLHAEILAAGGQLADAEAECRSALTIAQELGNPPQIWKTMMALGGMLRDQGKKVDALGAFGGALDLIEGVAAGLPNADLKASLLGAPQVDAIRDALK